MGENTVTYAARDRTQLASTWSADAKKIVDANALEMDPPYGPHRFWRVTRDATTSF